MRPRSLRRRLAIASVVVLVLLVLVLLPPFINVNRYQRRIAASISGSLGRPVHLDRVTLSLLPLPGFTLENFVVSEDPAFGYEPIIRANEVRATLRLSSLWRGRVEFSTIHFTEPSVNLVHRPDGKWNIEGILLQASRVAAAPTAQEKAGPAPRFPYIEVTGARLNLKQGAEKTPFSLADADFALWLPNPEQWRL
ncbi:MAG TPA: AsmA family protein, partial [Edaphobacter sp.]